MTTTHLGHSNRRYQYTLNGQPLEATSEEKDLGVIIDDQLRFRKHAAAAVKRANRVLGCIKRTIKYKEKDMIVPLYTALVRPLLEYGNVIWCPRFVGDSKLVEGVQRRATKLIPSIKDLDYTARLEALKLPSLEHRRRRGDTIQAYKVLTGQDRVDADSLFPTPDTATRGHGMKIYRQYAHLELRRTFFSYRVVKDWNSLPPSIVEAKSLDQFKALLDSHWQGERYTNPFQIRQ